MTRTHRVDRPRYARSGGKAETPPAQLAVTSEPATTGLDELLAATTEAHDALAMLDAPGVYRVAGYAAVRARLGRALRWLAKLRGKEVPDGDT